MSRTGKKPIAPVSGVTVTIKDREVAVKGPTKEARAAWGTTRALIANMVKGVKDGYEKKLQIQGVGFRAAMAGKDLKLSLGFSHEVVFPAPKGITITTPTQTDITVAGVDKQQVGQVAADIRAYRKPEPYKGKGVRYLGEYIARKEGKKK